MKEKEQFPLAMLSPTYEFTPEQLSILRRGREELRRWLVPLLQALRESPSKWLN